MPYFNRPSGRAARIRPANPTLEQKKRPLRQYDWVDKSGRNMSGTFNLTDLLHTFLGEKSWHGEVISSWVARSGIGDTWENAAHRITRTK